MLTEDRVREICNIVIDIFGKKIKGNRKIRFTDEDGNLHENKQEILFERTYQEYGFDISFLEETDAYLCIFHNDELVFNTVGDAYKKDDYDLTSPTLMQLFDEDDNVAATCFEHGDWEDLLEYIANHAEEIKESRERLAKQTKEILENIKRKNDLMAVHIPFRPYANKSYYEDNKIHIDNNAGSIRVCLVEEERKFLSVKRDLVDVVFDYAESYYKPGDWEYYVQAMIDAHIDKITPSCLAKGIDPVTMISFRELEANKKKTTKKDGKTYKSVEAYMDDINKLI